MNRIAMEKLLDRKKFGPYSVFEQEALVDALLKVGLRVIGIGSCSRGLRSEHDIDILVLDDFKREIIQTVAGVIEPYESFAVSDFGSYFFLGSMYGNVDVFFLNRLFTLATKTKWRLADD